MNTNVKLSVVMSCYNSSKFLRETMDSILGQTYRDFEFLIWNDGSTDDTETIIQSYHDDRIQYFAAPNQGAGIARAELCRRAKGEYIAVMDSDDVAYPQRLEKEVAFLDSHPDYILVSSLIDFMDEEGNVFGQSIVPCTDAALKKVFTISNPAAMFRKDAYEKSGGFLDIRNGQDVVLWGRMAKYGKYANLPEPLLKYRIQPNSIGRTLRQENYIQCLRELRKKVIADDTVDPNDLRLMDEIWKLNMEASKELPPPIARSVVNKPQQAILDIGGKIIGKGNMTRLMCAVKGFLVEKNIL